MKFVKLLGLAIAAAAAFMSFIGAGTAAATQYTCTSPPGFRVVCQVPLVIGMENEDLWILHPPIGEILCNKYSAEAKITNAGSSTTTASGSIEKMALSECNATVTVLNKGTMEVHTSSNNNGTVTSSGTEITVVFSGFHCIFKTNNTDVGVLTGSSTTGGTATYDTEGTLPRTGGSSGVFCGSTAELTALDEVTGPNANWLDVH